MLDARHGTEVQACPAPEGYYKSPFFINVLNFQQIICQKTFTATSQGKDDKYYKYMNIDLKSQLIENIFRLEWDWGHCLGFYQLSSIIEDIRSQL